MTRLETGMAGLLAAALLAGSAYAAGSGYHLLPGISGPDGGWDALSVDTVNNRVLVTRGAHVMSVDLATGAVNGTFADAQGSHAAIAVNGGAQVLITNGTTNAATIVDGKTGALLATVPTGKGPDAAILDPASGLVLVMDHAGGDITLVDPKTMKAVGTIPVGGTLEFAAVDGAGKAFVNVEDKAELAVIDIAGRKVIARYKLAGCEGPTGLAYAPADKMLISTCDGVADVTAAATGKLVASIKIGDGADGVAFDPKTKLAFASAGQSGTLSVMSIAGGKAALVETIKTQPSARTIAIDERTGRVYMPAATQVPPVPPARRPTNTPGSFHLLVAGK